MQEKSGLLRSRRRAQVALKPLFFLHSQKPDHTVNEVFGRGGNFSAAERRRWTDCVAGEAR
jgi:hypothetical protein